MQLTCPKKHDYDDRKSCVIWKLFNEKKSINKQEIDSVLLNQCNNNDGYGGNNYILLKDGILLKYPDRCKDDLEKSRNKCPLHIVKPYVYKDPDDVAPLEASNQTCQFWIDRIKLNDKEFMKCVGDYDEWFESSLIRLKRIHAINKLATDILKIILSYVD
jgi:hypothetical protein